MTLALGNRNHFAGSLDVLALIAELRRAKELATDYRELAPQEQREFVDDLVGRLVAPSDDAPSVCILVPVSTETIRYSLRR